MRLRPPPALAVLVLLLAPAARADEFWLCPSAYRAGAGDTLTVRAFAGAGFRGGAKSVAPARVRRLELRTSRVADLAAGLASGAGELARFVQPDSGGASLAYEGEFARLELPAPEFDAYLRRQGLDSALAARASGGAEPAGRERYARCCRTWIAGGDLARVLQPAGLTLEIVPLDDPGRGGAVPFRVLLRGRPLAGALVRAWRSPLGAGGRPADPATRDSAGVRFEGRTQADGVVRVPVSAPGEWLIASVHMEQCDDPAQADWQSWWASFTFARPGNGR